MKHLFILWACLVLLTTSQAQHSIQIPSNRFSTLKTYGVEKTNAGHYLSFGTTDPLQVCAFNFTEGNLWQMGFFNGNTALSGTAGTLENDSVFLVLSRQGTANTGIIKASTSGRVLWANWYNTGTDEHPDKILRLSNGDYLVSVRTNVDYYEFGEWGSRSGVMRISSDGSLKWFRLLDYRSANTSSVVLGMHELPGGNIILTQSYNAKLGLFKLSAQGDSIVSRVSTQDYASFHSAYDQRNQKIIVAAADRKLGFFDTSLNMVANKQLSASSLNSLSDVLVLNDTLLIGGKYNNQTALMYCDTDGRVITALTYSSEVMGLFADESVALSLLRSGMITRHNGPSMQLCFGRVNGSQFTTSSLTLLTFSPHVRIAGSATWDSWDNIRTQRSENNFTSTYCLPYDIAARPDKENHTGACPDFAPRLYLQNFGTSALNKFSVRYYLNGSLIKDTSFTLSPSLGSRQAQFFTLPSMRLNDGLNLITGKAYQPNDMPDEFAWNDSFQMEVLTRPFRSVTLIAADSFCSGTTLRIDANGPAGTYTWFRDAQQVKQGSERFYNTQNTGRFWAILSDSACAYASDTLSPGQYPAPPKPVITRAGNRLNTTANAPFVWLYNGMAIDSNTNEITTRGDGNYQVNARNPFGCITSSDVFQLNTASLRKLPDESWLHISAEGKIKWAGPEAATLTVYALDGKIVSGPTATDIVLPPISGIYYVHIASGNQYWVKAISRQ